MAKINEERVLEALRRVRDPEQGKDLVSLGMIGGLAIKDGNVGFAVEVAAARGASAEPLRKAAEQAVFALDGVNSVTAVLTAHSAGGGAAPGAASGQAPGPAMPLPPETPRPPAPPPRRPREAGQTGSNRLSLSRPARAASASPRQRPIWRSP